MRAGKRLSRPFLDVRSKVISGGEQGLLSIAFAPDYAKTRRFYVNYTDKRGTQSVVEYRRSKSSSDRADAGSARLVLRYDGVEANHNGGLLAFGPDKMLYIGTGDGGGADDQHGARGNAQDLGSLLGKLLRIDPRRSGCQALPRPAEQPVRRALRRARRDLQLRPAQPVALLLRPPDRRPGDRRRRPERGRGDRLRDEGRGARGQLRLAPVRGHAPQLRRARAGRGRAVLELTHADGNCSITGGYVVRDARRARAAGPLRLRRPLQGPAALGEAVGRQRPTATPRSPA